MTFSYVKTYDSNFRVVKGKAEGRQGCPLLSLIGLSNLETRYATLSNHLTKRIGTGQYRVGEYLPSEKQLAYEFGVSRPTVRRALEYVEALGLIGDGELVEVDVGDALPEGSGHALVERVLHPEEGAR